MAGSSEEGSGEGPVECWAEEVADARVTSRDQTIAVIEAITVEFLQHVASGQDPTLHLVHTLHTCGCPMEFPTPFLLTSNPPMCTQISRSEKNVVRDSRGHTHLGKAKTTKSLFGKRAVGAERFAKSEGVRGRVQQAWGGEGEV